MSYTKSLHSKDLASRAADLARDYLVTEEFNCAESTFWGILEALDVSMDPALMRVATPFGGGIGDSASICGALVGGLLMLGVKLGRSELDHAQKLVAYESSRQLCEQFAVEAGGVMCRVLNPLGFERADLRPFCSRYVTLAARLTVGVLQAGSLGTELEHLSRSERSHPFEEARRTWEA
jgi:C_GCAxxG_C_C family probable redox protein